MSISPDLFPTLASIKKTHELIKPYIHRTPVLTCQSINELTGIEFYFKCENLQKIGAFKIRGATNAILQMPQDERDKGVATHSSGNHAQAVALGAKLNGMKAWIVMPETSPKVKLNAVKGYGAKVIMCKPTLAARQETLNEVVAEVGASFIHPFDDWRVITGQATTAKEFIEDAPQLDVIVPPVGGGGLASGTALTTHYLSPKTEVVLGEPEGANDAWKSFQSGKVEPPVNHKSIADGLLTSLSEKTFAVIRQYAKEVITVTEQEIVDAMQLIWERMKIVVEPSGAVPLAAVLKRKEDFQGKKVGIIISGGNVDLKKVLSYF